ncbi:hypothetical protein VitviT2T_010312 [Vitis vinifera]|uniref:Uncharacterized protein n=1 Tax=Vitis vinifera TaxID=29760 RepID=A0ABY9C837_VITVI|nr:hypothetical protein VitviT2T_010312 [Vitis vinifera]
MRDIRKGMLAEKNSGCETPGWNVGGEEFRMRDIRMECRRRRIPDARHPGGMSENFRPGGMSDATHRKGDRLHVQERERATWHF